MRAIASAKRKSAGRVIGLKEKVARSYVGYKCGLIVREKKIKHEHIYKYCVGETAVKHQGMKTLEEKGLKFPKTIKDMLNNPVLYNQDDHTNLAVFGIQHANLSMNLLASDRPSAYITRINYIVQHV